MIPDTQKFDILPFRAHHPAPIIGRMPEKSVISIGAGIAGLAAGCYARMNGYRATVFELHDLPGGLCAARAIFTWRGSGWSPAGASRWRRFPAGM